MKNEKLFLYYLKLTEHYDDPSNWNEEAWAIILKHAEFLKDLGDKGYLICAGRTQFDPGEEDLFGIAVVKAPSQSEAEKMMANDPAVVAGIQQSAVYPFSFAMSYFENLKSG